MSGRGTVRRLPDLALQFGSAASVILSIPGGSAGTVIILAASGASRSRAENLAALLHDERIGTVTFSLPLREGRAVPERTLETLCSRAASVLGWVAALPELRDQPIGYLGVGIAGAVSLRLAEMDPRAVDALVVVTGRTELAEAQMPLVEAPTLLIEGDDLLRQARAWEASSLLSAEADVAAVPGGADPMATVAGRQRVAELAGAWFRGHFAQSERSVRWRIDRETVMARRAPPPR